MKRHIVAICVEPVLLCLLALPCAVAGASATPDRSVSSQSTTVQSAKPDRAALKREFQTRYDAWKDAIRGYLGAHHSANSYPILPEHQALLAMGVPVVPVIIDVFEQDEKDSKLDDNDRMRMVSLVYMITWKCFDWRKYDTRTPRDQMRLWVKWWKEERKQTPQILNDRYPKWDALMRADKTKEADDILEEVRYLGIDALPFVIGKISEGDMRLAGFVPKLARDRSLGENPSRETVLAWWEKNKDRLTLPDPEPDPVDDSAATPPSGASASTQAVKSAAP